MQIFAYLAIQDPDQTARLIRSVGQPGVTVILDLEDSLWDVTDDQRTPELKRVGRENLLRLATEHRATFERQPVGVRMNCISGGQAKLDLQALVQVARSVELACIVHPKTESQAELRACVAALRKLGIRYGEVVPIVETRNGIANLDEILEEARRAGCRWVTYGHYDLALDSGWWPIPEPDGDPFWEFVGPLIARIEASGLGYVQPPFLHLYDDKGLARIVRRIQRACARGPAMVTLARRQIVTIHRTIAGGREQDDIPELAPLQLAASSASVQTAAELAGHAVSTFLAHRRPGMSFAIDPRTGEFIAPHAYLTARDYLERMAVDG